jgi:hypothetical protein
MTSRTGFITIRRKQNSKIGKRHAGRKNFSREDNALNIERKNPRFRDNYNKLLGLSLPHMKTKEVIEEDSTYETMLLSEKNLAKDWLSDEDNRWDEVL